MSARSPLLLLALAAQRLTVLLLPKPNLAAPGAGSTGPAMLETTLHVCFKNFRIMKAKAWYVAHTGASCQQKVPGGCRSVHDTMQRV